MAYVAAIILVGAITLGVALQRCRKAILLEKEEKVRILTELKRLAERKGRGLSP